MREENLGVFYTIVYRTSRLRAVHLLEDLRIDDQLITELTRSNMIDRVSRVDHREIHVHIRIEVQPQHADEFIEATLDKFVTRHNSKQ